MNYSIAPSLLSADWANLGQEATDVLKAGADLLHFDVMDNHFVPNLTAGPMICEALRKYGIKAPIDVHLMVEPVDRLIDSFAKAGASAITFHPEASNDISQHLQHIRGLNCQAGLAINPDTSLQLIEDHLEEIDLILMMSVNPGFAGQKFMPQVLEKLRTARKMIAHRNIKLSIDGGIKLDNIYQVAEAGADTFVLGSGIFCEPNYSTIIKDLRQELAKVHHHE